jgi:hypothetical protein
MLKRLVCEYQYFRSGLDPESIRSVDPESGSRRAKLPTKIENVEKFHVLKCWMFSFEGGRLLL